MGFIGGFKVLVEEREREREREGEGLYPIKGVVLYYIFEMWFLGDQS